MISVAGYHDAAEIGMTSRNAGIASMASKGVKQAFSAPPFAVQSSTEKPP